MKIKKRFYIILLISLVGLTTALLWEELRFHSYYMHDFVETAINNVINGSENDKDNIVIRYKFDNNLSRKENFLLFLKNYMDCEYITDGEDIPLETLLSIINDKLSIGKQKKTVLCKTIRCGSAFSVDDCDGVFLSYSPSGNKRCHSFFEVLYMNQDEIIFSLVIKYGKIIDYYSTLTNSYVEEQFKIAMKKIK